MKSDINTYYTSKAEAARIRLKINVYEKVEKSTKYFFNLEKKNGTGKAMVKNYGGYKDSTNRILGEQLKFYNLKIV